MNALELFNLKALPQTAAPVRPVKRPRIVEADQPATVYVCIACKKQVFLTTVEAVVCPHCDCRIVSKTVTQTPRVYRAI